MEQALSEEQLPPLGWYDVLWALYRAPGRSLRPRDLGLHLTISKSGLTRLVDRIVAAGLIERRECPADRRGHLIALTAAGESMLREMWPVFAAALDEHFASRLSAAEARTLRSLLDRLREQACEGVDDGEG
jgi:DNA-binding MarR family transcriptional regulator